MFNLNNMEDWELQYYWNFIEERKLNPDKDFLEFIIRKIGKENIQPKYCLNIQEKTIPIFEFHLKEELYGQWTSNLEQALQLVSKYSKINMERVYMIPNKICKVDDFVATADKRDKAVYFPRSYLSLSDLKLSPHVWHENIHLFFPEQNNNDINFEDESEEFVAKKLSNIFGQIIISNWNPECCLSSCGANQLKWSKKTVMNLLEILNDCIEENILAKTKNLIKREV